ncbi:MAG: TIGR03790 family protein, partial [Bacillota bacterium]
MLLALCPLPAKALEPDEILLLVNQNVAESRSLAEFYCTSRNIPQAHILALDLPRGEDIAHSVYRSQVVPRVREFIQKNGLEDKISCIVTFYGTPLRIGARQTTEEEKQETAALQTQQKQLLEQVHTILASAEAEAAEFDKQFHPATGNGWDQLAPRIDAAISVLAKRASQTSDPRARDQRAKALITTIRQLHGLAGVVKTINAPPDEIVIHQNPQMTLKEVAEQVRQYNSEAVRLQQEASTAAIRTRLREIAGEAMGSVGLIRMVQSQLEYLSPANSVAAFDSELSLLWWNAYRSSSWLANPLFYYYRDRAQINLPRTLMVMRLDAPQAGMVRDIILASLKAERDGLKGQVVLDCRGMYPRPGDPNRGYAAYDQSIRNLATLIATKTKLPMLHDESSTPLPPGSATNVALYCGWYSVRNYIPSCRFSLGAVGFHVASFELISLKNPQETGWVRGLLNDSIAATLGSVA